VKRFLLDAFAGQATGASFLREIVRVDALDLICLPGRDPNAAVDHVLRERGAVDEDDCAVDAGCEVDRFSREGSRGQEHALAGSMPLERPRELLNLRPSDGRVPPLGLDVDHVPDRGGPP